MSKGRWIRALPSYPVVFNPFYLSSSLLGSSSSLYHLFPHQNSVHDVLHVCHTPCPTHPRFDHPDIWWTMKLSLGNFLQSPVTYVLLGPHIFLTNLFLNTLTLYSSLFVKMFLTHSVQSKKQIYGQNDSRLSTNHSTYDFSCMYVSFINILPLTQFSKDVLAFQFSSHLLHESLEAINKYIYSNISPYLKTLSIPLCQTPVHVLVLKPHGKEYFMYSRLQIQLCNHQKKPNDLI
jgi:hypothetical protein